MSEQTNVKELEKVVIRFRRRNAIGRKPLFKHFGSYRK